MTPPLGLDVAPSLVETLTSYEINRNYCVYINQS